MTSKVFEHIYTALKRDITGGRYLPGQRLQSRSLAEALGVSTSPITDVLRQLVGEDVLDYSHVDGFLIPRVTDRRVRDLYAFTVWLASADLPLADSRPPNTPEEAFAPALDDITTSTEALFQVIAADRLNGEVARSMANANDKIRSVRRLEIQVLTDLPAEHAFMAETWNSRQATDIEASFQQYLKRRLDIVPQLVSLSYQDRR